MERPLFGVVIEFNPDVNGSQPRHGKRHLDIVVKEEPDNEKEQLFKTKDISHEKKRSIPRSKDSKFKVYRPRQTSVAKLKRSLIRSDDGKFRAGRSEETPSAAKKILRPEDGRFRTHVSSDTTELKEDSSPCSQVASFQPSRATSDGRITPTGKISRPRGRPRKKIAHSTTDISKKRVERTPSEKDSDTESRRQWNSMLEQSLQHDAFLASTPQCASGGIDEDDIPSPVLDDTPSSLCSSRRKETSLSPFRAIDEVASPCEGHGLSTNPSKRFLEPRLAFDKMEEEVEIKSIGRSGGKAIPLDWDKDVRDDIWGSMSEEMWEEALSSPPRIFEEEMGGLELGLEDVLMNGNMIGLGFMGQQDGLLNRQTPPLPISTDQKQTQSPNIDSAISMSFTDIPRSSTTSPSISNNITTIPPLLPEEAKSTPPTTLSAAFPVEAGSPSSSQSYVPESIKASRTTPTGVELLVQWQDYLLESDWTWETLSSLQADAPELVNAWLSRSLSPVIKKESSYQRNFSSPELGLPEQEEEEFEEEKIDIQTVEKILAKRVYKKGLHYLVKWEGFEEVKDMTWEPCDRLKMDVPEMVEDWEERDKARRQRRIVARFRGPALKRQKYVKDRVTKITNKWAENAEKRKDAQRELKELENRPVVKGLGLKF